MTQARIGDTLHDGNGVPDPGLTPEQYDRYRETWQALARDAIAVADRCRPGRGGAGRVRLDGRGSGVPGQRRSGSCICWMRVALEAAYAARGRPAPPWTDAAPVAGTTPIRAGDIPTG